MQLFTSSPPAPHPVGITAPIMKGEGWGASQPQPGPRQVRGLGGQGSGSVSAFVWSEGPSVGERGGKIGPHGSCGLGVGFIWRCRDPGGSDRQPRD